MAEPRKFNELLKHIQRVRAYMQNFYIYGFLTREDYDKDKSTYDNERRRVELWMAPYYGFRMTKHKRICFVSFDSRNVRRNPLYRALKSKSFTDNDITLHFLILDVMAGGGELTVNQVLERCERRIGEEGVYEPVMLRKKLDEYDAMGIIDSRRDGRERYYRLRDATDVQALAPALAFFSEVAQCGVVGSYLEDRLQERCEAFSMKHHYIAHTLDSELLHTLLEAMHTSRDVLLEHMDANHRKAPASDAPETLLPAEAERRREQKTRTILPLYILRSVQDGRMYVLGWGRRNRSFISCRLDRIASVKLLDKAREAPENEVQALRAAYDATRDKRWGASLNGKVLQHIDFTVRVMPWEGYVRRRLYRECRGGSVEEIGNGLLRFSAEVYDPLEIIPWVRSFMGRIVDFNCDSPAVTRRLLDDLVQMQRIYAEEPAGESGVQA